MSKNKLDPVSLEILWNRLVSIVDEAAAAFVRTSFSSLVREANDYAVVVTDADGRSLAQSSMSIPSFISTLPRTVAHFLEKFPADTLKPGDVLITNDPWMGTGHIHDVSTAMPIFHKGELVAFSAVTSHMPDIGGTLRNIDLRSIYEEGLQIPRCKFLDAGEPVGVVLDFIGTNNRVPEQTLGDLWGQVAAHKMQEARLIALIEEAEVSLIELGDEIHERSERALRNAIAEIPDGTYRYVLKNDGFGTPIIVDCKVTVAGDDISVDYEGSSSQFLDKSLNVVWAYTYAYTAYPIKALLCPDVPNNEGGFRPITVTAPPGSLYNPDRPVGTGARGQIGHLLPPAVIGALSPAMGGAKGGRAYAEGSGNTSISIVGHEDSRPFATVAFTNGGQGAGSHRVGHSTLSFPSNLGNNPIEVFESEAPVLVHHRAVRGGSGGEGGHRGGDGLSFKFEYRGEKPGTCSFLMPRREEPPLGAAGGTNGAHAHLYRNGEEVVPAEIKSLNKGDVMLVETAGGGGYGKPD